MKIISSSPVSLSPITYQNYNKPPDTSADVSLNENGFKSISRDEQDRKLIKTSVEHETAAYVAADAAIFTMNKEVNKIQKNLDAARPDLKNVKWDFVMKDGKFEVTGAKLSDKDANYIAHKLNVDKSLVGAVNSFTSAAVLNLETSQDNPSLNYLNAYTGRMENHTFYKVADQMNGTVSFKALLSHTKTYRDIDPSASDASQANNLAQMGGGALDVLASQLTASNHKIDMNGFTFDPIDGTLERS